MYHKLQLRNIGHVHRKILNDRYARNRPEHRTIYYQKSFLTANRGEKIDLGISD